MIDLTGESGERIHNWIANYERKGATDTAFYRAALEERARRDQAKNKLDIEKSLACLRAAAIAQTCTTYGDLAKASGVPWSRARHAMNGASGHLDRLLDICHARGLPLLTAICVNQAGIDTGQLEPDALKGFAAGARRLRYAFANDLIFHHEQRAASWAWGEAQAARAPMHSG